MDELLEEIIKACSHDYSNLPWHDGTTNKKLVLRSILNTFCRACRATPVDEKSPKHAYEVSITIGGNNWAYVVRTLQELASHIQEHGAECNLTSGSCDGGHSVSIAQRAVTPEQYQRELEQYLQGRYNLTS